LGAVVTSEQTLQNAMASQQHQQWSYKLDCESGKAIYALDCEFVGVHGAEVESAAGGSSAKASKGKPPSGKPKEMDALAQVCIVDQHGQEVYKSYCQPRGKVVDYRTKFSGVKCRHLVDAPGFETVRNEVKELIQGNIVVGHSIQNDFRVLQLSHPLTLIRDTATASYFMKDGQVQGLRKLTLQFLNRKIQNMMHEAGEDARATLDLYKLYL
jgi:DNA polymerase III epsilon subunit-like protein